MSQQPTNDITMIQLSAIQRQLACTQTLLIVQRWRKGQNNKLQCLEPYLDSQNSQKAILHSLLGQNSNLTNASWIEMLTFELLA